MSLLLAMAPPMSLGGRLIAAALGFGLVLILSYRLRGSPAVWRCGLAVAVVLLSVFALEPLDSRGMLAFLAGALGAILVGHKRSGAVATKQRALPILLAIFAVPIGLCMGLGLFGIWYWQTNPIERGDVGGHAAAAASIGLFAGFAVGVVTFLLGFTSRPPDSPNLDRGGVNLR